MTPSFLICGGQRCGTTSMYRALAAHPVVLKAVLHKGVHYFDTSYDRGHGLVPGALPVAAQRRQDRPSATACRRRPSSRARTTCTTRRRPPGSPATCRRRSSWCWSATRWSGPTRSTTTRWPAASRPERDFGAALALEPARLHRQEERLADDPAYYSFAHQHHAYRARGEYARYLSVMAQHVGRERIHVVESERFFTEPEQVYDEVCDVPRAADLSGAAAVRAAQRPPPAEPTWTRRCAAS